MSLRLNLHLDDPAARRFRARLRTVRAHGGRPTLRAARGVFLDTPQGDLAHRGLALCLFRDGGDWVQRLVPVPSVPPRRPAQFTDAGWPLATALPPDEAGAILASLEGRRLHRLCGFTIRRVSRLVRLESGAAVLISLDRSQITTDGKPHTLQAVEFRHVEGVTAAMVDLALFLVPDAPLRLGPEGPAERGLLLAARGWRADDAPVRTARPVALGAADTVGDAALSVLQECADQISANVAAVLSSDAPEGPHQLRIGLRRLRTALSLFGPAMGQTSVATLSDEARWLAAEVGALRDLDVLVDEVLDPLAAAHPGETGFIRLAGTMRARADETRGRLRTVLTGARVQGILLRLACATGDAGLWSDGDDPERAALLGRPVRAFAAKRLQKRWAKVTALGADIETLDMAARHELRKELKKLRYASEFAAPLFPRKHVARFVKHLRKLQDVFGLLNDAAGVHGHLTGQNAPLPDDPGAQHAAGWAIGAAEERARLEWPRATGLWDDLARSRRFWS